MNFSRRTLLRSTAAAIALPFLESALGRGARAATPDPLRAVWLYQPNGIDGWTIGNVNLGAPGETSAHTLGGALTPLVPFKQQLTIVRNLDNLGAGTGVHNSGSSAWLTGKAMGTPSVATVGISADQVAAPVLSQGCPIPSLQIGTWAPNYARVGMDSSCNNDYLKHISWQANGAPMRPLTDPAALFTSLFGTSVPSTPSAKHQLVVERSILDSVTGDAADLNARISVADRVKVDEYLTQVRATELKIAAMIAATPPPPTTCGAGTPMPAAMPASFDEHLHVMFDLLTLALSCNQTRVASFHLGIEFGDADFTATLPGVKSHHSAVHTPASNAFYSNLGTTRDAYLMSINQFYANRVAYFLGKLMAVKESSGTLLDNTVVVWGAGLQYSHVKSNLYTTVAGGTAAGLRPGRHGVEAAATPLSNLQLTVLNKVGVTASSFGASTRALTTL